MQALMDGWFEIATILYLTVMFTVWINVARSRARRREQELRLAARALDAHYTAVSKLVDDPALPAEAKALLVTLTEGISRREVAEKLGAAFEDGSMFGKVTGKPKYFDDLEKLYRTRPDLAELYQTAVMSALTALFLRWPGNAAIFQRMAVEISTDVRKESAITGKAVEITRKLFDGDRGNHNGRIGPGSVTAAC